MILIDKVEVPMSELSRKLGKDIPFEKIIARPVFEIDGKNIVKDPANGPNAVRMRNGMDFPSHFRYKLANGKTVEIRYCTGRSPNTDDKGNVIANSEKFVPKYVTFEEASMYFGNDEDQAVYFFLHFFCKSSPLRKENEPAEYDYVDDEARANARIDAIQDKRRAMLHADSFEGDALRIVAKGIRIPGVHGMDERTLKAAVMEYALNKPGEFMTKSQSQVSQIEGLIIDAVDKKIFTLVTEYDIRKWKWVEGVHAGNTIVELISNGKDAVESLITAIQADINRYLPVLLDISKTLNAKANAVKELEKMDIDILSEIGGVKEPQPEPEPVDPAEPVRPPFPHDYASSMAYVKFKTGKGHTALASQLTKGIQSGQIDENVIDAWFDEV